MSTKRAIFSTDNNPVYAFFAPLTALMWREVAGFDSVVLTVGGVDAWVKEKCVQAGAKVVHVCPIKGVGVAGLSQIARLWGYMHCDPEDWVVMGDGDAWPLNGRWFNPPQGRDCLLLYAESCVRGEPGPSLQGAYPMGYIGMRAKHWAEVLGTREESIENAVCAVTATDPEIARRRREGVEDVLMNYDEAFITSKLKAWPGYPSRCLLRPRRGFPLYGRIDRAAWPERPDTTDMMDAHLLRPGWTPENWPRILPLLEQCLPPSAVEWAKAYHAEWLGRLP